MLHTGEREIANDGDQIGLLQPLERTTHDAHQLEGQGLSDAWEVPQQVFAQLLYPQAVSGLERLRSQPRQQDHSQLGGAEALQPFDLGLGRGLTGHLLFTLAKQPHGEASMTWTAATRPVASTSNLYHSRASHEALPCAP